MKKYIYIAGFSTLALLNACSSESEEGKIETLNQRESKQYDLALQGKLGVFKSLPKTSINPNNPTSDAKVKLGHVLYFDERLSENNTISCNSCHNLATFGVDNLPTSPGTEGKNGDRNSPTVLNASLHTSQFWDGRVKDVEEQAGMPILNPVEMNIPSKEYLINKLSKIDLYQDLFSKAYPKDKAPINYENLQNAIGNFERQLLTPSRFDDYLLDDFEALTVQEKKGLSSFINIGCTTCHIGPALGGNMIQKFGKFVDYWELTKSEHIDLGLATQTGDELDKYKFKVPSLRNIEKTAPYFHDGSVRDLKEAVKIMAISQLDYDITDREVENIVAFLKSLTGKVPEKYATRPVEL